MKYESLLKSPESEKLHSGRVLLEPGESMDEHTTGDNEEMIVVLSGVATVLSEHFSRAVRVPAKQFCYVSKNTKHSISNDGKIGLEYIYIVTPCT